MKTEKVIKENDWLVRGVPQEELAAAREEVLREGYAALLREKDAEIERSYSELKSVEQLLDNVRMERNRYLAERDQYQSEMLKRGEEIRKLTAARESAKWVYDPNACDWGIGAWVCSKCGAKNENLGGDKRFSPYIYVGSNFCPHCGRLMTDEH